VKARRLRRRLLVTAWPALQVIGKYADRLLDNLLVLVLALVVAQFDTLVVWLLAAVYVASQWYLSWTMGEHIRISHHRNFWHRIRRKP
jgi:hypothetical protein